MWADYGHILDRLHKLKRVGRREKTWVACCPAHADRHPSLLLFVGKRGELVARCLSNKGCTWQKIAAALDTKLSDWWPPRDESEQHRRRPISAEIECTYDYADEMGKLIFQAVRYKRPAQPRFRQRRPLAGGQWAWNLDGVQMVIYRLPELLARPQQPVLIVEGERDVETLRAMGFVATTGPCGSSAWRPDYARWLRGRRVAILPDNDEPGERYAMAVAGSCVMWGAASIRVVRLPGLPEGGDVSDWVEDSLPHVSDENKRASLIDYIKAANEYRSAYHWDTE